MTQVSQEIVPELLKQVVHKGSTDVQGKQARVASRAYPVWHSHRLPLVWKNREELHWEQVEPSLEHS